MEFHLSALTERFVSKCHQKVADPIVAKFELLLAIFTHWSHVENQNKRNSDRFI